MAPDRTNNNKEDGKSLRQQDNDAKANRGIHSTLSEEEEKMLIMACQRGDQAALESLYRHYAPRTYAFLGRILGPHSESLDDVVHDVFIEVLKSIKRFKFKSKFSTWLYRITVRVSLRGITKKREEARRLREVPPPGPDSNEPSPAQALLDRERNARLWNMLKDLPEAKRVAIVLAEAEGLSAQEISEITGARVETVYSRVFYARKALLEKMVKDEYFREFSDE